MQFQIYCGVIIRFLKQPRYNLSLVDFVGGIIRQQNAEGKGSPAKVHLKSRRATSK